MNAVRIRGLTKRYRETVAVDDLDLAIERGEVFGLVGPNGAGKSTTIAILLGYRFPTEGEVAVFDRSPIDAPLPVRRRIGALPEDAGLLDRLSAKEHVNFLVRTRKTGEDVDSILDRVELSSADRERPVRAYSTGMKKRVLLALALVGRPDLLLLDEPAAGLDPAGIDRLRRIIRAERERGAAIVFSSHHLADVAAVSDRVGFLVDGKLRDVTDGQQDEATLARRFHEIIGEAA